MVPPCRPCASPELAKKGDPDNSGERAAQYHRPGVLAIPSIETAQLKLHRAAFLRRWRRGGEQQTLYSCTAASGWSGIAVAIGPGPAPSRW